MVGELFRVKRSEADGDEDFFFSTQRRRLGLEPFGAGIGGGGGVGHGQKLGGGGAKQATRGKMRRS